MKRSTPGNVRSKWMKFALVTALVAAATVAITVAYAANTSINFEPPAYTTGTIDGQNGWAGTAGGPINPAIDEEVVVNGAAPASFGTQSWRFSNAYTNGSFGDWPFSPSLTNEAGETLAQNGGLSGGTRQPHYEVQFDFASAAPGSEQVGLQMSTASDRGDGARMTFIRLRDTPTGLAVEYADYQDAAPYGAYGSPATAADGCGSGDAFVITTVASGLNRAVPHTVRVSIDFVDGPRNDVVRVYVDGAQVYTGTTWEDYFRWCEGGTGTATDQSRTVDSQLFQARDNAGTCASCLGYGFLIDNLSFGSGTLPTTAAQCKNGGWQNYTRANGSTFKNQGDCIQYVNTGK